MSAETVIESGGWCSICALPLIEYTQRYFMGSPINPTCDGCDDVDPDDVFASFPNDFIPPLSRWDAAFAEMENKLDNL